MASSTQFLHSFLPLLPNLRPKYSLHSSLPFLPPKPTPLLSPPILNLSVIFQLFVLPWPILLLPLLSRRNFPKSHHRKFSQKIPLPGPEHLVAILNLQRNAIRTAGPLFFASMRDRAPGSLNTPLTVVAAGLAKWLDIYSGVLMALLAQFSMEAASDWLNSSAYVSSNEMLYAEFIFNVDAIKHGNGRRGKIGVERGNCFY
ncbi:hypothetical protein K1719_030779 [Acacia pycnantha]|nr:hypothetical protein K1719_030779 [Acacia pycnantha]